MDTKIKDCQTIAELTALVRLNTLSEAEQRFVFEKKMEIFQRIREWRIENERLWLIFRIPGPQSNERDLCMIGETTSLCCRLVVDRKDLMVK